MNRYDTVKMRTLSGCIVITSEPARQEDGWTIMRYRIVEHNGDGLVRNEVHDGVRYRW